MTLSILMVDDSPILLNIQKKLIEKEGYAVTTATSGKEALCTLKQHRYDLILMDMQMPEMNGLETAAQVRNLGISTPILALTGNDSHEDKQKCLAQGMNGFVAKPLKMPALIQELNKLILG